MAILRVESYKKGILVSSGLNIINKFFAFLSTVTIAFYFGTQFKTDLYYYVIATFTSFSAFFITIDSSVLIAKAIEYKEREGQEKAMQFLNFFLYLFSGIVICISLVIAWDPVRLFAVLSNFNPEDLFRERLLIIWATPFLGFTVLNTFLTDILFSYKYFTIPSIAGLVRSVLTLLFILIFHSSAGILSVVIGTLAAHVLNFFILVYLMRRQLTWNFRFKRIQVLKEVWNNIFYAESGNVATILAGYLPLFLLSGITGGIIAALNYARRITELPQMFITQQFSTVVSIKFNESFAKGDLKGMNDAYLKTVRLLLFLMLPLAAIFFILGDQIIRILYSRGAFDKESVKTTADFFKYFALVIPFFCLNTINYRLFVATQTLKYSFYYQIFSNIFQLILIYFALNLFGYIGYPVVVLFGGIMNVLVFYFYSTKLFPYIRYGATIRYLFTIITVNAGIAILVAAMLSLVPGAFWKLLVGVSLYLGLLMGINQLFGVNKEISSATSALFSRRRLWS